MKVHYSTNWQGPVNLQWIKENGKDWCAGRIDVYGNDVPEYTELSINVMKSKDWIRFTRWLEGGFTTPEIWTTEQLVQAYEFHNPKITWWEKK